MRLCIKITRHSEGGFRASCPSLPGCQSHGHTQEQAKEKLLEAIRGYLASLNEFVPEQIQEVMEIQA
jgi:predicted RNase H-like HicB family nuclease